MSSPIPHEGLSSISGVWAELVLRDISDPVLPRRLEDCCQPGFFHAECMPSSDEVGRCLNYWRGVPTLSTHKCQFDVRELMNGASGYLDGSDIYGNNDDRLHKIRTYNKGRVDVDQCDLCNVANSSIGHIYQVVLHEHNRIADILAEINEHWDDGKIFLEARRAVVAQVSFI